MLLTASPARREPVSNVALRLIGRWWIAFAASAVFVVAGHLMIKAGLNALTPSVHGASLAARMLHAILQPQVVGGLLVYGMGTVCWMRTVSKTEISFIYPLSSINYVLVVAASTVFFQEVISPKRAAGVLTIVLGMILMTRQSGETRQ